MDFATEYYKHYYNPKQLIQIRLWEKSIYGTSLIIEHLLFSITIDVLDIRKYSFNKTTNMLQQELGNE